MGTNWGGPALAGVGLALVAVLAAACVRAQPPPHRLIEAPQYRPLQLRPLKVQVLDRGNFLGGDAGRREALVASIGTRLASGGVTVSPDAPDTLVLELASSQQPAQGESWCVHVSGWVDTGQPAFLPHRQWASERCAAITHVERNQGAAFGELLWMGIQAASGALSRERSRSYAVALGDCIEDVLGQLGGASVR